MHVWTNLKPESDGVTGKGIYADGMVEHDGDVGTLLDLLDELKIADNTIVIYTTDNGPHYNTWPEEYQLGGWLSGAGRHSLAGQDQTGRCHHRACISSGLGADSDGCSRRS